MTADLVLPESVDVINVGLPMFADAVRAQGRPVQHVDWRPPAVDDPTVLAALRTLHGERAAAVERANAEVLRRLDVGVPFLETVAPAASVVPSFPPRGLLHCGPALAPGEVCDPLWRSMRAAVVAEGWAGDVEAAGSLLLSGAVSLEPANHHDTVVPMATAIGPSTPMLVVSLSPADAGEPIRAYAPVSQGPGEVPWFGRDTDAALARLRLLRDVVGPALALLLDHVGPLDVLAVATQGIAMGDDLHMRTQAATNLLARSWMGDVAALPDPLRGPFARFLTGNHLFFLTVAMAAARSLTAWAGQVEGSSIVTSMARNGTTFGIRLPGSSDRWFVAPAPPVGEALYSAGHGPDDAAADIGDSAVLELVGLGGPAAANSPAVAAFLGGAMSDAAAATEAFRRICVGASSRFTLPALGFTGTPLGVDVRKVVESGVTPKINTGILAASGGGQVGAGVATAPPGPFAEALVALAAAPSR